MPVMTSAADLRAAARRGEWRGTTAGHCPAYQQLNLVILPRDVAAEFAAFCTRNPKPCPIIEITVPGDPEPVRSAPGADLRTDVPGYRIYGWCGFGSGRRLRSTARLDPPVTVIAGRWPVPEQIEDIPTKNFKPGDVIFREGDESQSEAYLVHEGTVEAHRQVNGEDRVLNTLVKGDLLGEVALFRDAPHSVTAIAVEHVTLLVIPAHRLESMVRANPELAIGLIRQLARMAATKKD